MKSARKIADFFLSKAYELSAKLTLGVPCTPQGWCNAYKSAFHFVSRILHLNSFSPQKGGELLNATHKNEN